jgi:aspartyl protease family protein
MARGNWLWIGLGILGLALAILLLMDAFPGRLNSGADRDRLIYLLVLLPFVCAGLLTRIRARPGSTLGQIGIWVAIFAILVLGYSFRNDFAWIGARVSGELTPSLGMSEAPGEIGFPLAEDGHYYAMAIVDGVRVEFMIDSGASDIVLSPGDARRLGHDLDQLRFTVMAETANGTVFGAPIRLGEIAIGPIVMRDLPAHVNQADMSNSLLGMTFLNRLRSWHVENARLTLRQ